MTDKTQKPVEEIAQQIVEDYLLRSPGDTMVLEAIIIKYLMSERTTYEAKIAAQEKQEKAWQEMCQKHVGCSMLADEFSDEPHDPEGFGRYVENLSQQIASLEQENEILRAQISWNKHPDRQGGNYSGDRHEMGS